jgi:hypothetical protein
MTEDTENTPEAPPPTGEPAPAPSAESAPLTGQMGQVSAGPTGGNPKNKVVAILLAVFLGFWTWLYTYRADGGKFWLGLIVTVVTIGIAGLVFWIWSIIDTVSKSDEWYATYD